MAPPSSYDETDKTDPRASATGESVDGLAAGQHDSVNAPTNEPDEKPKGEDAQAAEATKIADDDNKGETPDGEGK